MASTEIGPFHTRLTHSLKVAQLGRRLAERIRNKATEEIKVPVSDGKLSKQILAPDPDLVEFACLAHDLGHPPFGHTGERALHSAVDRIVAATVAAFLAGAGQDAGGGQVGEAQRVIGGFEGNPQSFRIVTRLSHKASPPRSSDPNIADRFLGLDLTAAAIDSVSKYPWGRDSLSQRKWGAYGSRNDDASDLSVLNGRRELLGYETPTIGRDAQNGFECSLMDWCDDVTYAVHDVEDFYMIGLIPLDRIFAHERHIEEKLAATGEGNMESPSATPGGVSSFKKILDTDEWASFRTHLQEKWKDQIDFDGREIDTSEDRLNSLRAGLIVDAYGPMGWGEDRRSIQGRRYSHRRTSDLISYFAGARIGYGDVPMLQHGSLRFNKIVDRESDDATERERWLRHQCRLLKELIWQYVIDAPGLKTQQAGQRRIVDDLLEIHTTDISLVPPHYRELAQDGAGYSEIDGIALPTGCLERLAEIRVAADYVASLTEPQAVALHRRLTGVELGGFRDFQ